MPRVAKKVWFLMVPETGLFNVAGPWEVMGHANDLLGYTAYDMTVFGPQSPVTRTSHGIGLCGVRPLPQRVPAPPDIAIVAGAPVRGTPAISEHLVPWLQRFHARIPTIVSICSGAFVLAAAGLLDGRRATTHWMFLDELRARYPRVSVVDEGIFVKDGHVWTSAGVTAGIDLTLALVEADFGREFTMALAKRLVLFLRRSGNQAQFSAALQRQEHEPPRLQELCRFVLEHLDEPLPVLRLAQKMGMSVRTLSRFCKQHFTESPAELVRRLRVDEARRLLEETSLPLKAITQRTGLGDSSTLWRVFTAQLGVTPAAYRERFNAAPDAAAAFSQ